MKIVRAESWTEAIPLTRPYAIAFATTETAELAFVRLTAEDGTIGLGCAAPVPEITGETFTACVGALEARARLVGRTAEDVDASLRAIAEPCAAAPAARAALDTALHDLWARLARVPLFEALRGGAVRRDERVGERRSLTPLPTSVTIGIRSLEETLAEADEYVARGFVAVKAKIGVDLDGDVERVARLRERLGPVIALRVDANMGYDVAGVERFVRLTSAFDVELIEQPTPPALDDELRSLPAAIRRLLAADESLHGEHDVAALVREPRPYGVWNVKLMKCGGIAPALRIARAAHAHGVDLMWGCMDESVIGIAAALHAAGAADATRYLDLDGSFDLARDPARGGFELVHGRLRPTSAPGLGVEIAT